MCVCVCCTQVCAHLETLAREQESMRCEHYPVLSELHSNLKITGASISSDESSRMYTHLLMIQARLHRDVAAYESHRLQQQAQTASHAQTGTAASTQSCTVTATSSHTKSQSSQRPPVATGVGERPRKKRPRKKPAWKRAKAEQSEQAKAKRAAPGAPRPYQPTLYTLVPTATLGISAIPINETSLTQVGGECIPDVCCLMQVLTCAYHVFACAYHATPLQTATLQTATCCCCTCQAQTYMPSPCK